MSVNDQALIEKLRTLPPQRRAEVEDFVDFLKNREEREHSDAAKRLGEAFKKLDALDLSPMSEDEVQAEIDAARRDRAQRR